MKSMNKLDRFSSGINGMNISTLSTQSTSKKIEQLEPNLNRERFKFVKNPIQLKPINQPCNKRASADDIVSLIYYRNEKQ